MKPILIPNVSVGEIAFGTPIEDYADAILEYTDYILEVPYHCYSFSRSSVTAYTDENGQIENLSCDEECIWKSVNLIGMNIVDFEEMAGQTHDGEIDRIWIGSDDNGQLQEVYEYDSLGLQIWVCAGAIVTVIACIYED